MNMNYGWFGGIGWIFFWVGIAIGEIGEMSGPSEVYPWYLPLLIMAVLVPPFVFGFIAGIDK